MNSMHLNIQLLKNVNDSGRIRYKVQETVQVRTIASYGNEHVGMQKRC